MRLAARLRRVLRDPGDRRVDGCQEAARLIQGYLDGEICPPARSWLEDHLEPCRRCGLEVRTYEQIKAALARIGSPVDELSLLRLRQFGGSLAASSPQIDDGR